jgi:serine/threonine protein phosphatase PrpC
MKFSIEQESRAGSRSYNQDRVGHWSSGEALLMVLADGMGGYAHGEVAAEVTVRFLGSAFRAAAKPRLDNPEQFLTRAIGRTHAAIRRQAVKLALGATPCTTVVACVVQEGHAWWSWIGDSRLYLVREGSILARTRDHTLVQELVDGGALLEELVASHPDRNKLVQCLGGFEVPRLEPVASARLATGDIVLLCSDGFWGPLTQRQLLKGLLDGPPERAIRQLVALAEQRAGSQCDNVSVLAMQWQEGPIAAADGPRTMPFYDLPTEVQDFSATDPDALRMTEADIDGAIAEIRAALKKRNPETR